MDTISRRTFSKHALSGLLTYSVLEMILSSDAVAANVAPIAKKWLKQLNDLSQSAKDQKITQLQWQSSVESLFSQVAVDDFLQFIDFDKLAAQNKLVDHGARSMRFSFPEVEGLPKKMVFGKQIFGLKKKRSVIPHGHNNMATAFLILKGKLRGRHYDRLKDADDHLIIKPTIDRSFKPGEFSTISDHKDNVHWFEAETEPAYIFNIHVLNVNPKNKLPTGRVYVNPNGEQLADGLIRAPRIGYKQANQLFGG